LLCAFGFGSLGVTIEDLYFIDPEPEPGQEGAERGVRVELRLLEPQRWRGSVYASQPVLIDQALWRADFFESVSGGPGTKDRMHHHPLMEGDEPGRRVFDPALTADPMGWLRDQLSGVTNTLEAAEADWDEPDAAALRAAAPLLVGTVTTLLEQVRAGEIALAPTRPMRVPE
jgi:hypothetical protein